jgi:hypothetical protein
MFSADFRPPKVDVFRSRLSRDGILSASGGTLPFVIARIMCAGGALLNIASYDDFVFNSFGVDNIFKRFFY